MSIFLYFYTGGNGAERSDPRDGGHESPVRPRRGCDQVDFLVLIGTHKESEISGEVFGAVFSIIFEAFIVPLRTCCLRSLSLFGGIFVSAEPTVFPVYYRRFPKRIFVGQPSAEAREALLQQLLKKQKNPFRAQEVRYVRMRNAALTLQRD